MHRNSNSGKRALQLALQRSLVKRDLCPGMITKHMSRWRHTVTYCTRQSTCKVVSTLEASMRAKRTQGLTKEENVNEKQQAQLSREAVYEKMDHGS